MKPPNAKNKKSFSEQCYTLLRRIPRGKLSTYKNIAHALNCKAYRAVGNAMNKNPYAPKVPCHRVVKSDGQIGGYASGTKRKEAILRKEGIRIKNGKVLNLERYLVPVSRLVGAKNVIAQKARAKPVNEQLHPTEHTKRKKDLCHRES